jgi:hypothetical protein
MERATRPELERFILFFSVQQPRSQFSQICIGQHRRPVFFMLQVQLPIMTFASLRSPGSNVRRICGRSVSMTTSI